MSCDVPERVAIALGSNVGDREAAIREALRGLLEVGVRVERVSSLYETAPVGWGKGAHRIAWFLNAACVGETFVRAAELLGRLHALEVKLGRSRAEPDAGLRSRAIDLDLVLYGRWVVRSARLVLPHPRFRERAFVLWPLREIAADWIDPVTGRTVADLAALLERHGAGPAPAEGVRLHAPPPPLPAVESRGLRV